MASLDPATVRARVAAAPVARLATVTADGEPHVVPICFTLAGERIYSAVDHKPKTTAALKRLDNVAATPTASLLVDHYADDWTTLWWARADGVAGIVDDGGERAGALAALAEKYHQYEAEPPRGPMLRIDVTRWTGWTYTEPKEDRGG